MEQYKLPNFIKDILNKINERGYEAYLVGGAVRDLILNKNNKDYDLCTNMPLSMIKELYPKFVIMKPNNHRNTGVMRIDGLEVEISEFRGNTLEEDLSNRDFSMNAIVLDKDGNLIDPYNGLSSITKREISLIKKDGEAFAVDPLRILRAVRIAAKMEFGIDDNCRQQMIYKKKLLDNVPTERIYRELIQFLVTDNPSKYIRENLEIFFEILPELKPMYKFEQMNKWHIYDILEHTLVALENTEPNIHLRLAVLFHDIGKPKSFFTDENGVGHFYGHPEVSANMFDKIALRLKMDNKTKRVVRALIEKHDITLSRKPNKIYEFLKNFGIENISLLFALKRADNMGQNPEMANPVLEDLNNLEQIYSEYVLRFNNLQINGQKLVEMGYKNKKIKLVLEDVRKQVVTSTIHNTEEEITDYIRNKYRI